MFLFYFIKGGLGLNKMLKRFFSILLSILMFVTTIPADCLVAFAVSSGQPTISSGSKYVVSWETISGNKGKIPKYNKDFSNNGSKLGSTNLLKKYVNTSSKSAEREPNSTDVPIYRVSRSHGYTSDTTKAQAVTPVNYSSEGRYQKFIDACKKDDIVLSEKKASMIYFVLQNGLKQFTATSGDTFYKQQLHFLATQCLIWEIEEGKRTGWGNETKYTNATASAYPSNSKSLKRSSSISTSYSHPSSGKNKNTYFWHDYYYTCKATKFNSSYPDYYNEILEAAALQSSSESWTKSLKYNTGNEKNVAFSSEKVHEMTYSTAKKRWERTYTIATPSMLGSSYGKFDTNDIVLPIRYFGRVLEEHNGVKNVKVYSDANSYTW